MWTPRYIRRAAVCWQWGTCWRLQYLADGFRRQYAAPDVLRSWSCEDFAALNWLIS